MTPTAVIVTLVLIAGALALVLYPLWKQTRTPIIAPEQAGQTLEEYQVRYQAGLASIKDLMFDYEMGKVTDSDYQILLAKAKAEAAQIRKQLDALRDGKVVSDPALDAQIEALIAQTRAGSLKNGSDHQTVLAEVDTEIERLKRMDAADILACPDCGRAYEIGDAFCAACGYELDTIAPAQIDEDACPQCGYTLRPDDAFCARCGAKVSSSPELAEVPA